MGKGDNEIKLHCIYFFVTRIYLCMCFAISPIVKDFLRRKISLIRSNSFYFILMILLVT